MNNNEVLAEAVRVEIDDTTGEVYIVFKAVNEKFKKEVKTNWCQEIEYKIVDKKLYKSGI